MKCLRLLIYANKLLGWAKKLISRAKSPSLARRGIALSILTGHEQSSPNRFSPSIGPPFMVVGKPQNK
jgi:hypothetical protein